VRLIVIGCCPGRDAPGGLRVFALRVLPGRTLAEERGQNRYDADD
jgi:hypothetical protein